MSSSSVSVSSSGAGISVGGKVPKGRGNAINSPSSHGNSTVLSTGGQHASLQKTQQKTSYPSFIILILLAMVCFLGGTFVGSKFVHKLETKGNAFLPGSVAIVNKMEQRLRGPAAIELSSPSNANSSGSSASSSTTSSVTQGQIAQPSLTDSKSISPNVNEANIKKSPIGNSLLGMNSFSVESDLLNSFHCSKSSFMIGPSDLDSENLIVSAWIRLDGSALSNDMRTILTNKASGCESSEMRNGFSLYVNEWQTNNRKLYLEYGGKASGCNKLNSGDFTLQDDKWYHVAGIFLNNDIYLYVDGKVVGQSSTSEAHSVQASNKLIVGLYENKEYPFSGNISHVTIIHLTGAESINGIETSLTSLIQHPMNALKARGVFAYFPLLDSENVENSGVAADLIRHGSEYQGKYSIIQGAKGHQQAGVSFPLVDGLPLRNSPFSQDELDRSDTTAKERREIIKDKVAALWKNYKDYAWGYDELKPISGRGDNNWGGMAVTLVDSLDTLWLLGLKKEFDEARDYVANRLSFSSAGTVSVFETTIRELGGLLSAYDLSGEKCFLNKAEELGNLLLPAFDTSSGIPRSMVNFQSRSGTNGWAGNTAILSELGSLQIEFRRLAELINRPSIVETVMKPLKIMKDKHPEFGLYPIKVDLVTGGFADSQITFGALGDSFYEYLLKLWLQTGKKEAWLRQMYDDAMDGAIEKMLLSTDPSGLAFLSDFNGNSNTRKMDHLVCFMPGLLALGSINDPQGPDSKRAKRDLAVAKALMYTCREMYHRMPSGISAEYVEFPQGAGEDISVPGHVAFYILRPETAESLFILHQVTRDPTYREWAWEIFSAIDKHCKTSHGYGALRDVRQPSRGVDDRMESFFIAETLKYLYLAQDPDTIIDLSKYVFNTEAHPTKIYDLN